MSCIKGRWTELTGKQKRSLRGIAICCQFTNKWKAYWTVKNRYLKKNENMDAIERIKQIILDNNYFDTLGGQRFLEWNQIRDIPAIISFGGRSKKRESYRLTPDSDSESLYVTHLYLDRWGEVRVQIGEEDNDDFEFLLKPGGLTGERIESFAPEQVEEWVKLLTY